MNSRLHLRLLLVVMVIAIIGSCTLGLQGLAAFLVAFIAWALVTTRSAAYSRNLAIAAVSLLLPLIVIHGWLNPSFRAVGVRPGWDPSSAGVWYALELGMRIVVLFAAGFLWQLVRPGALIDDTLSFGLPLSGTLVVMHAVAMAREVPRRAQRVFIAQRARGVPVSGNFVRRLRAIPALLVPVIVRTLSDSVVRSQLLHSRGFGGANLSRPSGRGWDRFDFGSIAVLVIALLLCWFGLRAEAH